MERAYTIPLRSVYNRAVRKERAKRAMKHIREFIAKHMKVEPENVKIHESVNHVVWQRGIEKPPRKIKVIAVKEGETVWVYTPEARAEIEKSKKSAKHEPKKAASKKTKAPATEEQKTEQETGGSEVGEKKEEKSEQA